MADPEETTDLQTGETTELETQNTDDSAGRHTSPPQDVLVRDIFSIVAESMHFSGPIPPPSMLKEYNEAAPGAADLILKMAELQQAHRIETEREDTKRANRGQILAFLLAAGSFACGTITILHGHDTAGTIFGGGTILSLVYAFIRGNAKKE